MEKNYELELYKLIIEGNDGEPFADELRWVSDTEFCIWVSFIDFYDFMSEAESIFGCGIFDDGGFTANIQTGYVCIDLCEMFQAYLDVENVFPKEKYSW